MRAPPTTLGSAPHSSALQLDQLLSPSEDHNRSASNEAEVDLQGSMITAEQLRQMIPRVSAASAGRVEASVPEQVCELVASEARTVEQLTQAGSYALLAHAAGHADRVTTARV